MNNITKTNTRKSTVELRTELGSNGVSLENVYVNGKKFCCVGYVSEKDKKACLNAIQIAIDTSDNEYEAMMKLMTIANFGDKEVSPDKEIVINEVTMFISYQNKAVYDSEGEEICNCRELECELPNEAVEAILIPRAEKYIEENY